MERSKSKSVSFATPPSNDPQSCQSSAAAEFSRGNVTYSDSYGDISQTAYGQINVNPLAFSTPAYTHSHSLSGGLLSNSSVGSQDSIISQEPFDYVSGSYKPDAITQTSPTLWQSIQGFNNSFLLPESTCTKPLADYRYKPASVAGNYDSKQTSVSMHLQQVTSQNSIVSQAANSPQSTQLQDSGIHLQNSLPSNNVTCSVHAETLPVVTEQPQILHQAANTNANLQVLQQQLLDVQRQLQHVMLQQQSKVPHKQQTTVVYEQQPLTSHIQNNYHNINNQYNHDKTLNEIISYHSKQNLCKCNN